ncbi:SGNH/GDSL hydrolase family protein [Paractinoplanes lichenicola]|uniref:PKD domain-containing protein n=1 Tax=Paractinoplanes lichenicola TaxID=2802976 RepID=A0ABS1VE34_9ACTN|nr:SGNH/GDSL hydrolase family protein [Actinoplanes lichenicola]MBL7252933.1 hypothetical protein [Actinoplanes lichenicola]
MAWKIKSGAAVLTVLAAGTIIAVDLRDPEPAAAATANFYVALGDSYSSGEGTYLANSGYDKGTTENCHRSDLGWARMLTTDPALNLTLGNGQSAIAGHIACSGAVKKHLVSEGQHSDRSQVQQLAAMSPRPALATVTIGGNDAGFSTVAKACFKNYKCFDEISSARKKIETMELRSVYTTLRSHVANGRLVVVGYPRLFDTSFAAYTKHCSWAPFESLGKMNDLVVAMNKKIRAEADAAGVDYVDVQESLKGHELCTGKSWVRSITIASGKYNTLSAHPLREGQAAIRDRVATYLRGRPVLPAPPVPGPAPVPVPGNRKPVAAFQYSRLTGAGNRVALDGGSSSDSDGTITAWAWSTGGRQFATGRTATASFGNAATPAVTLTVTDNRGATASVTRTLSLPNRKPGITVVTPRKGTVVGDTMPSLSVAATDPDGDPLTATFRVTGPSVELSSAQTGLTWKVPPHRLDPGAEYRVTVTVRDPSGQTATGATSFTVAMLPTSSDVVATSTGGGYWQVDSYGGVFSYGDAPFHGSLPGLNVRITNIIGMARTPDNGGYWLVGSDGGVFAFGNAGFHGSMGGKPLSKPVVGMAVTPTGKGYWLAGADGGVFAFGDAGFFGSMGGKPLDKPVTAIGSTASGRGYWLAAEDGGVFAFGDAGFFGSMGGKPLNKPVVDLDVTPDGGGYWMTAEDGGVFAFGNAGFFGSMAGRPLNGRVTGMSVTPTAVGYWLNGCDGGIFAFGDAAFRGSRPTYQCRGV